MTWLATTGPRVFSQLARALEHNQPPDLHKCVDPIIIATHPRLYRGPLCNRGVHTVACAAHAFISGIDGTTIVPSSTFQKAVGRQGR